jgi:hypothetical protein
VGTTDRWTDEVILQGRPWAHVPAAGTFVESGECLVVHRLEAGDEPRVALSWPARGGAEDA